MKITHRRDRYQHGSLTIEGRKNGPNVYVYRWREKLDAGVVKRKQVLGTVKELNKTQAQKKAEDYRQLANSTQPVGPASSLTVAALVDHYSQRELGVSAGRKAKVVKAYLYIFKNYIVPQWGHFPLGAVRAVGVEDWLKSLSKANGTKAKIREVFGAAFRHAMRYELFPSNPISNVRQERKRTSNPSIFEPSELTAIMRELEGVEPTRTAFLIAALTGMRRGEVFGLKWLDINFDHATLNIERSWVDGIVGLPKTDSSRRPIPIPSQALEALQAYRAKSDYNSPDDWVFASGISFGKQPFWPGTLWQRNVTPAIIRAGISKPKVGWHTLRRTYASLLFSTGANLRVSMELMRHSSAEMTLATYAQSVGNEKREAGGRVASLVMGKQLAV